MDLDNFNLLKSFKDYFLIGLDISLVAFLFYRIYLLISKTRAVQISLGIIIILLFAWGAQIAHLQAASWLVKNLADIILITIIVIMAPEIRRLVSQLGQDRLISLFWPTPSIRADQLNEAVRSMCEEKTGALIVIARQTGLNNFIEKGEKMDAIISSSLIRSIFFHNSPLHDGAMIIDRGHIAASACYLPLSNSRQLKRGHGARHRAGLGISEESDALVIICSEESGKLSICMNGNLLSNLKIEFLRSILNQMLLIKPDFESLSLEGISDDDIIRLGGSDYLLSRDLALSKEKEKKELLKKKKEEKEKKERLEKEREKEQSEQETLAKDWESKKNDIDKDPFIK